MWSEAPPEGTKLFKLTSCPHKIPIWAYRQPSIYFSPIQQTKSLFPYKFIFFTFVLDIQKTGCCWQTRKPKATLQGTISKLYRMSRDKHMLIWICIYQIKIPYNTLTSQWINPHLRTIAIFDKQETHPVVSVTLVKIRIWVQHNSYHRHQKLHVMAKKKWKHWKKKLNESSNYLSITISCLKMISEGNWFSKNNSFLSFKEHDIQIRLYFKGKSGVMSASFSYLFIRTKKHIKFLHEEILRLESRSGIS